MLVNGRIDMLSFLNKNRLIFLFKIFDGIEYMEYYKSKLK